MKSTGSQTNASRKFRANTLHWPPHRAKRKRRQVEPSPSSTSSKPNQIRTRNTSRKKLNRSQFSVRLALLVVVVAVALAKPATCETAAAAEAVPAANSIQVPGQTESGPEIAPRPNILNYPLDASSHPPTSANDRFQVQADPIQPSPENVSELEADNRRRSRTIQSMNETNSSQAIPNQADTIKPAGGKPPSDQSRFTYTDAAPENNQKHGGAMHWPKDNERPRALPRQSPPPRPMVNRYQAQSSMAHNQRRPPMPPSELRPYGGRARWGRNNVYKRVLLCDKTLVSLDYLRREQPVSKWSHEIALDADSGWDETIGDMGSSFDDFFSSPNGTTQEANLARSSGALRREPEWLLPDDDPLVLCDMWDLEKGLLNRKPPEQLLSMAVKADFNTVREAIKRCRQLSERALPLDNEYRDAIEISTEDMISMYSIKRGLIPGTKWCGLGDIAATYNDLGQKRRIDICCRAHDHCPIRLKPFRNDYGLFNIALYTKSHCECDADFYRCLREVRSKTADMLGNLYFNVMKLQCLREEPMKMCREIRPLALGFERCVKYEQSVNKTVFRFSAPPRSY